MPRDQKEASVSKNGVSIRLTEERWLHIVDGHAELLDLRAEVLQTVAEPERVLAGNDGAMMAVRTRTDQKVLVAIYREVTDDGFVVTAFLTRRLASLNRRTQLWPSPKSTNF